MGPLVIKERFKETRVYSCGDTERRAVTKGTGGRHKSLSPILVWLKKKARAYLHTHRSSHMHVYQQMKKKRPDVTEFSKSPPQESTKEKTSDVGSWGGREGWRAREWKE